MWGAGANEGKTFPSTLFCRSYNSGELKPINHRPGESPYAVDYDGDLDYSLMKVPFLRDAQKEEMYALHKSDPVKWTVHALAEKFGARQERIKAVLYLRRGREELLAKEGLLDIAADWTAMHQAYVQWEQEKKDLKAAQERHDKFGKRKTDSRRNWLLRKDGPLPELPKVRTEEEFYTSLAETHKVSKEQAKATVLKMIKHSGRLQSDAARENVHLEMLAQWEEDGANVSFRETPLSTKKKVADDYYPILFGDEGGAGGFDEYKENLRRRVLEETKALVSVNVDTTPAFFKDPVAAAAAAPGEAANNSGTATGQLGRWKWAFRDLAKKDTQPTMIRTRTGLWRPANVLEAATRSWVRRPLVLDTEFYKERVAALRDPDGDEPAAKQLILDKTSRRKTLLAAQPAK